ncbi:hypothetical protein F5X96DRAFT_631737 [Biscogniauxia mediterranea]|nr:hypothetical protein F5X96DRAFT_631737 [Biscogniauxia mediterranea]
MMIIVCQILIFRCRCMIYCWCLTVGSWEQCRGAQTMGRLTTYSWVGFGYLGVVFRRDSCTMVAWLERLIDSH